MKSLPPNKSSEVDITLCMCTQKVLYGAPRHLSFLKFPWQPSEPDGLQMTKHAYEWKANCWTRRGFHTRLFISSNAFHHGKSTASKFLLFVKALFFGIEFQCSHNNFRNIQCFYKPFMLPLFSIKGNILSPIKDFLFSIYLPSADLSDT